MAYPLVVCGLNHKTSPVDIRSKFVVTAESLPSSLEAITSKGGVSSAMILSTCHRTEIYAETQNPDDIISWWSAFCKVPLSQFKSQCYIHENKKTVQHLLRVACGLDSMVLGEPEILGQLKVAANAAKAKGTLNGTLTKLVEHVFGAAKQIRTETQIGKNPLSLGHAILHLAINIFDDLKNCKILFIGAGEMINLVSRYFQTQGISEYILANRTYSNAEKVGLPLNAKMISLQEVSTHLQEADIIISAIHQLMPFIGKGMVETALKRRKNKPMLMVDLGVPRNIEGEIKNMEDVYLYHMDELQKILEENHKKRRECVNLAEEMITLQTQLFYEDLELIKVNSLIQNYRNKMKDERDKILKDALKDIATGEKTEEILEKMAYQLTNKLLHDPCLWLKESAVKQHWPLLNELKKRYESLT